VNKIISQPNQIQVEPNTSVYKSYGKVPKYLDKYNK